MSFILNNSSGSSGGSSVTTITGNSGGAVPPTAGNINIIGAGGVTVSGTPGTSTLTITASATAFTWNEITGTSSAMLVNNGYVANNAGLVTLTLPAVATFGDVIQVVGKGAGLWAIAQNAGQSINFGTLTSTVGAGGSVAAISQYDCVSLLCTAANTTWTVTSAIGNLTVV